MKKLKVKVIVAGLILLLLGFVVAIKTVGVKRDYREAWVSNKGLVMWGVSFSRRMINRYDVDGQTMVWIPEGYGWYRSDKVGKILTDENKRSLIDRVFFYNFGYLPNKVNWVDDDQMDINYWSTINYFGWKTWLSLMLEKYNWLFKTEELNEINTFRLYSLSGKATSSEPVFEFL